METDALSVNLDRLLKLRLVVARHGEMDLARWWNSRGMLGRNGATVLKRGFPSTHYFAQARIAFAVVRNRCSELFKPPDGITLWGLTADIEDRFEEQWQTWLDHTDDWAPFFQRLSSLQGDDLLKALSGFKLLSARQFETVGKLRRSAAGRAVPLPGTHQANDDVITLLAAGFARGEPRNPAVPYARIEA